MRASFLLPVLLLAACGGQTPEPVREAAVAATATPPADPMQGARLASRVIDGGPVIRIHAEGGVEENGQLVVDAFERDFVYMAVTVEAESGQAQGGTEVDIRSAAGNNVLRPARATDEHGYMEFSLIAARPGRDTVTVSAAGVSREFVLSVVPMQEVDWLADVMRNDVTRWERLMNVDIALEGQVVQASFGSDVLPLQDQKVKLAGFMLPLEPAQEQRHFLLSASPPHCFFHVPGGPSTVAEVFADKGIPMTFDPIIVEGRLELVAESEMGILYKLRDARPVPLR
jgi:hypothetical protein